MNRVVLVGRLTRDPELRNTNSGVPVVSFTIAVNRTFTSSQSGEREADFINCICFNKQAENLNRFIKKGGLVGVDGRIQTRSYTAQDGSKRYVTEVVCENIQFLEPKGSSQSNNNYGAYDDYSPYDMPRQTRPAYQPQREPQKNPFEDIQAQFDITDDDLPF
ncbi:MAG: single-stranded DNA-binding protein [Bacilli bacterium]|nr:single-stranded DNA-binding protein [Bacilli bacterium]